MDALTSFAICLPSRGLVHSRTIEAVLANVDLATADGLTFAGWALTHDLPIPDCDERVAELGLATGADTLWFVEEDVLPPPTALVQSFRVLRSGAALAAVDYPVGAAADEWGCIVRENGAISWCGLGCTLIRRTVFEQLPRPWFRTDLQYVRRAGAAWTPMTVPEPNERRYGKQDIGFCIAVRAAGLVIGQVEGLTAGHAQVDAMGQRGSNVGWHQISVRQHIRQQWPG